MQKLSHGPRKSCDTNKSFLKLIKDLTDLRAPQGKIYEIQTIVIIAIMGIMNGYLSFRALEDYTKLNKTIFTRLFKLKK